MQIPLQIDWATIIGFISIGQAFLLCLYLSFFHADKIETWLLVGLLVCIIIALGHDVMLYSRLSIYLPYVLGFDSFSIYLHGPFILLITKRLLWPNKKLKWFELLHFIPFVIHFFYHLESYTNSADSKREFLIYFYENINSVAITSKYTSSGFVDLFLFFGHRFIYIGIALYILQKYRNQFEHASTQRQIFGKTLRFGLIFYCGFWLVLRIIKLSFNSSFGMEFLMINSLISCVMVIAIALILFRYSMNDIFTNKSTQKYQQSPMDNSLSSNIVDELESTLTNTKLFRNADLKITDIVEKMGLSSQLIYQALYSEKEQTFSDFVNAFRLEYVKEELANPDNKKLDVLTLAFASGFNSKATFYRLFKHNVGMTPSQYRNKTH